jgi:hypothetical protein
VVVEITARRANSEYQTLHLTLPETEKLANVAVEACSVEARARLVVQLLKGVTDAELLKILASDFKRRVA